MLLPAVIAVEVRSTVPGEHTAAGLVIERLGNGFTVMVVGDAIDKHPFALLIVTV